MKENEEREQNNDITPNGEVSPVKHLDKTSELDCQTEEPDSTAADSGPLDDKDPSGGDAAQGALGQVKAKVEVCKDESVGTYGKWNLLLAGGGLLVFEIHMLFFQTWQLNKILPNIKRSVVFLHWFSCAEVWRSSPGLKNRF